MVSWTLNQTGEVDVLGPGRVIMEAIELALPLLFANFEQPSSPCSCPWPFSLHIFVFPIAAIRARNSPPSWAASFWHWNYVPNLEDMITWGVSTPRSSIHVTQVRFFSVFLRLRRVRSLLGAKFSVIHRPDYSTSSIGGVDRRLQRVVAKVWTEKED